MLNPSAARTTTSVRYRMLFCFFTRRIMILTVYFRRPGCYWLLSHQCQPLDILLVLIRHLYTRVSNPISFQAPSFYTWISRFSVMLGTVILPNFWGYLLVWPPLLILRIAELESLITHSNKSVQKPQSSYRATLLVVVVNYDPTEIFLLDTLPWSGSRGL